MSTIILWTSTIKYFKVPRFIVILQNLVGFKVLYFNEQIAFHSTKDIKGLRMLDRTYIAQEQARIAARKVKGGREKARKGTYM